VENAKIKPRHVLPIRGMRRRPRLQLIDETVGPARRYRFRFVTKTPDLLLDLVPRQKIVGIQVLNVLTPGARVCDVTRRRGPGRPLRDHANAVRLESACDRQAIVDGAIVHDDDLLVAPALSKRTLECAPEPWRRISAWH
jgi:hypothetical protein